MTTVQPTTDTAMERMSPRALLAAIALAVDLPMPYDVRIDPRLGILHIQLTTFAAAAVWAQESGSTLEHHMCEGGERHWVGSDQLGRWNDWETDISAFEDLPRPGELDADTAAALTALVAGEPAEQPSGAWECPHCGLRIAAPQPMEIVGPPAAVLIREHLEEHAGEAPVRLRLDAIGGDAA